MVLKICPKTHVWKNGFGAISFQPNWEELFPTLHHQVWHNWSQYSIFGQTTKNFVHTAKGAEIRPNEQKKMFIRVPRYIYIYISCFNRDSPTASFDVFACFFVMPGFAEGSVAPGALTKLLKKTILRSAVLVIVILPRLGSARAHYSSRSTKTWVPPTTNGRKTTNMLCCCFFGGNPWSWLVFCCFFMFSIMLRLNLQVCEALLSSGATTTSRTLWLDWGGCET